MNSLFEQLLMQMLLQVYFLHQVVPNLRKRIQQLLFEVLRSHEKDKSGVRFHPQRLITNLLFKEDFLSADNFIVIYC